ncbi:MAG: hypothetical protein B7X10_04125, partial [Burkholderiales bacterium 21-58-4]
MIQPLRNEVEPAPVADTFMNLGSTLKALREAKELSLGDVSARLKYSGRQIEALESEQWDSLPTGVSLRGLVRNYGRFLDANT